MEHRETNMNGARRWLIVLAILTAAAGAASATDQEQKAKQAELDAACEAARQEKLAPLRAQYVEECVEKQQRPDRESCQRFYADFGNRSGDRAPLFYDLPECVAAHEYRTKDR
jgi:hypothetical protein